MKTTELKALAEKATPGPWLYIKLDEWSHSVATKHDDLPDGSPNYWTIASINKRREPEHEANGEFIAEANPAAILALISALESAQERVKALEAGLNGVLLCGRGTSGRIILEGWQEEAARALLEKTT